MSLYIDSTNLYCLTTLSPIASTSILVGAQTVEEEKKTQDTSVWFNSHSVIASAVLAFIGAIVAVITEAFPSRKIEDWLVIILIALIAFVVLHIIIILLTIISANLSAKLQRSSGEVSSLPVYNPSDRLHLTPEDRELLQKNRRGYIQQLDEALGSGCRAVAVLGVKGVGKSTLAAYYAKPGDLWIDFIGKKIDLPTLLTMCAQWLDYPELESVIKESKKVDEHHIKMLCDRLQGDSKRLFFDNLETLLDEKTRRFRDKEVSVFFESLIRKSHCAQIVITSRISPVFNDEKDLSDEHNCTTLSLKGLEDEDGAELLEIGGIENTEEVSLEEISREVDGNPLLLKILPPLVKRPGGKKHLKDLKKWKEKFEEEGIDSRLLSEAAQKGRLLIYRLSIIPELVTLDGLRFLCGKDLDAEHWAGELVSRSLLERSVEEGKGYYRLHPAILEAAQRELERRPRTLRAARKRAVGMYLAAARQLKSKEEWRSLEDCLPLIRAAEMMIELGDWENATPLVATTLLDLLSRWGHWRQLGDLYKGLLDLVVREWWRSKKVKLAHSQILNNYGILIHKLGDSKKAIEFHKTDLEIAKELGDREGEGKAYGNLGIAYDSLGDFRKAIFYLDKVLAIAKELGDREGEGKAYGNLGNAYQSMGDFRKAIEFHEKDLEIAKELGDRSGEGKTYGNLGNAYGLLGNFNMAIDFLEKQLKITRVLGDRAGEARANFNLGSTLMRKGDLSKSAHFAVRGLLMAMSIEMPDVGSDISLVRKCQHELGHERFREIAVESVGEEGADAVDSILARVEAEAEKKINDFSKIEKLF